jgi:hypothetical protein
MSVEFNSSISRSNLIINLDAANKSSYSPNTYPYSRDIYAYVASGGASGATISRDTATASSPAGGIPLKMIVTGSDPYTISYGTTDWTFASAAQNQTWTISVYIKASASTNAGIFIFVANSDGTYGQTFNPMWTVNTAWQRYSYTFTITSATTTGIQLRYEGPDSGTIGTIIWFDGIQVERTPAVTAFNGRYNQNSATWADVSGNNTNATFSNLPVFSNDQQGVLTFNGTTNTASINYNSALFTFDDQQSIVMWFKNQSSSAQRRNPYNMAYGGAGTITHETDYSFNYYYGTSGADALPYTSHTSPFTVNVGETAQVVITRTTVTTIWYKNGQLGNAQANPYGKVTSGTQPISIGSGYAGYFEGGLYLIQVYNRAISASEVQQNFNAYRGRFGL